MFIIFFSFLLKDKIIHKQARIQFDLNDFEFSVFILGIYCVNSVFKCIMSEMKSNVSYKHFIVVPCDCILFFIIPQVIHF